MSDTIPDLVGVLTAQRRLEERLAKAAHALAEAEERAEDDPAATAEVARCRKLHDAAEAALASVRARRRAIEAQLTPREVARAYALLAGAGRG
jgi:hypothetical protein